MKNIVDKQSYNTKEMTSFTKQVKPAAGAQFLRYFGPILNALQSLGGSGTPDEVVERIVQDLNIPDDVQNQVLASGGPRFRNQVAWARKYLAREGLLDSSKRGIWSLSERGRSTSLSLEQAQEIFRKWAKFDQKQRSLRPKAIENTFEPITGVQTLLELSDREEPTQIATDYRHEVLAILKRLPPAGFERLSQRLLREAGFTQVEVTGKSGDGGIDGHGTLQINPLVTFKVLFQCKKYSGSVSPSHVRDFRGAMSGRADKGLIITTGTFTAEARREATRDGAPPIELLDGDKLVDLLENLELGLRTVTTFEVDPAFFQEFSS
jgi:restriction system protein